MSSGIQFTDILIALEPTGFSSQDASLVLGLVATGFIVTMGSLLHLPIKIIVLSFKRRDQDLRTLSARLKRLTQKRSLSRRMGWWNRRQIEQIDWLRDGWHSYRDQCWQKETRLLHSVMPMYTLPILSPCICFSRHLNLNLDWDPRTFRYYRWSW